MLPSLRDSRATKSDLNQTWIRDGTNTPIWNRRHPDKVSFQVMASKVGNKPGQEIALTDKSYHTWAYPRWTKDEAAIVYHASPSLYLYTL